MKFSANRDRSQLTDFDRGGECHGFEYRKSQLRGPAAHCKLGWPYLEGRRTSAPLHANLPPDSREFRNAIGQFATGVAVIACEIENEVHAMTANAVSSLSLDPMQILFCPSKRARMFKAPEAVRKYTVNILRSEQRALSTYFARAWKEPTPPPYRFVPSAGGPRLEGSLASISCETAHLVDGGDHWIVIGRVLELHRGVLPHHPLLFFNGKYCSIDFSEGKPAPDLTNVQDEPPHIYYDH